MKLVMFNSSSSANGIMLILILLQVHDGGDTITTITNGTALIHAHAAEVSSTIDCSCTVSANKILVLLRK